MTSRRRLLLIGSMILAAANSGCGKLGTKAAMDRMLKYASGSIGCLNDFGAKAQKYAEGTIDSNEWAASMDCMHDSLALFQQFVSPTDSRGYSRDDIRLFASEFLVTKQPISAELVGAAFELKSSLLGGDSEYVTANELGRVVKIVDSLKEESLNLLPYLKKVSSANTSFPGNDDLFAFMDALKNATHNVSSRFNTSGNPAFKLASAEALVKGAAEAFRLPLDTELAAVGLSGKAILLGGNDQEIDASDWPALIDAIGIYGGPAYLVTKTTATPDPAIVRKVNDTLYEALNWSIAKHGGAWPLALVDTAIDRMPASWITIDRGIVKAALRPLVSKLLWSKTPGAFDTVALKWVHDRIDDWYRADTHIRGIFARLGADEGATAADFAYAAHAYASHLEKVDRDSVEHMVALVRNFRPFFAQGDEQMHFFGISTYSLNQVQKLNWMNLASVWAIASYSSHPSKALASNDDLRALFQDFLPLAGQLKFMDARVPGLADMRFRDISLFTPASIGGDYLTVDEVTYYMGFAASIGVFSERMREQVMPHCANLGDDSYGTYFVSYDCFAQEFFGQRASLWDHFPEMQQYYGNTSGANQSTIQQGLQASARLYGISSAPVGRYDMVGYAGTMHYVESLFSRFDTNRDGVLDLNEIMAAYPVFKGMLVKFGNLDPNQDFIVQAVFTYIVKYGEIPGKNLKFVEWLLAKPFWKIHADRAAVYTVLSKLAQPAGVPRSQ